MENRRLVEMLIGGVTVIGAGALSLQVMQSPWPGYGAAVVLLVILWFVQIRSRMNRALEAAMALGAEFGEHQHFLVEYLGGHPALQTGSSATKSLLLTADELLLLDAYRAEPVRHFAVRLADVRRVAAEGSRAEIIFVGVTGERHTMTVQMKDTNRSEHLADVLGQAAAAQRRRGGEEDGSE